ncbi:MAG TPA: ROK family transcriptional regulator [Bryobacteraceae bacterium]|nr:ROK family transcriptional regulator [Bryobacteraceae bacterium]HPT27932.1 ROK family transcriptional regulator [Bryobacteraceae bacterium]
MRKLNAALLLNIIRDKGLVSRAELARLSGLTKPTVSSQVADLIKRGIVVEDGEGAPDARGGKPPMMLRFDAQSGSIIAAEIASSSVRVWLADLDGRPFDSVASPIKPEFGAAHVLDVLCSTVYDVLARTGRRRSLLSVAIAAPGRVDANTGTVLEAGNVFHWRNVEVRKRVEDHFGVAAIVDNDVNFAALGEMHSGLAVGVDNFILIRHGTGVGAGLVLGGRLYQGTHWAAGEIGHMIVDRESAAEDAADRGMLELAIGSDRVRERVLSAHSGQPSTTLALSSADLAGELAELVRRNDVAAALVLDEVASQVSIAVADMAATIDPELIVLAGELFGLVADRIRELVGRVIPWPMRIELSALGADAALMGAMGSARGLAHDLLCDLGRDQVQLSALR